MPSVFTAFSSLSSRVSLLRFFSGFLRLPGLLISTLSGTLFAGLLSAGGAAAQQGTSALPLPLNEVRMFTQGLSKALAPCPCR